MAKTPTIRICRYFGAKTNYLDFIYDHFPEDWKKRIWIEGMAGGGVVTLNKPRQNEEIINDQNKWLATLYKVIRTRFEEIEHQINWTLYSADEFARCVESLGTLAVTDANSLEIARSAWVVLNQSMAGEINSKKGNFKGVRKKLNTGGSSQQSYRRVLKNLPDVNKRLQGVNIRNENVYDLLKKYSEGEELFYLDPPYLAYDRNGNRLRKPGVYNPCEMETWEEHKKLAANVKDHPGCIMLCFEFSGDHPYDEVFGRDDRWMMVKSNPRKANTGNNEATEAMWLNYKPKTIQKELNI